MTEPAITRRIGSTPQERGSLNNGTCPDVFECECDNEQFNVGPRAIAIIGTDHTTDTDLRTALTNAGATVQPHDRVVVITRETFLDAMADFDGDHHPALDQWKQHRAPLREATYQALKNTQTPDE
jgi:hypothetical protein